MPEYVFSETNSIVQHVVPHFIPRHFHSFSSICTVLSHFLRLVDQART